LAKRLNVGRSKIRKIIRGNKLQRNNGHDILTEQKPKRNPKKKKKLDAFIPTMNELVEKYPKITGVRMFEELQTIGFEGSISLVREKLRKIRPVAKITPISRFETESGLHYGKNVIMVRNQI